MQCKRYKWNFRSLKINDKQKNRKRTSNFSRLFATLEQQARRRKCKGID